VQGFAPAKSHENSIIFEQLGASVTDSFFPRGKLAIIDLDYKLNDLYMRKTTLPRQSPASVRLAQDGHQGTLTPARSAESRAPGEQHLLRLAEDVASMGHWYADLLTGHVTWSPQVFRMLGFDAGGFTPTLFSILDICHADDRARVKQVLEDASAGAAHFEFDCRITRPDGASRTIISTGQAEHGNDGQVVALFGVMTDVTEAFATIRDLQDQNEMLDLAAQLAQLGHWVWTRDVNQLTFCSDEMARIHELTPSTFVRQFPHPALLAAVVAAEDRDGYRKTVSEAIAGAKPYDVTYGIRTRSGALKQIREIGHAVQDADGALSRYIATAQDISEAKRREDALSEAHRQLKEQAEALRRSEDELKRKTAELQRLNSQKDKLFSIIAHDLRSPFNSIIGFADLLVSNARDLSHGQTVSYAQIVRESASGVHNLLDNLLAWASFQIRDGALKLAPMDLSAVIAASLEPLAYMAETKGITISNGIDSINAMGDEAMVRIVVRNLVSNGIKFSRHGGVVQLTAARVSEGGAEMVRITVRDDGVGMSGAALANLFDMERTVSAPGTRGESGTGLGLYLCHDIVARHGGTVSVDSAPGTGTAFHFTLPIAP
jgi:signal transduction histidine kinase